MTRRRGRKAGPSDPEAIRAANALRRGDQASQQRRVKRTPGLWGVSAEILTLPTSADVDLTRKGGARRGAVVAAKRSDPFDLLHAAGGLTDEEHRAARRLIGDWSVRAGVRITGGGEPLGPIDGGRGDPQNLFTDAVVDAGRRVARVLKGWPEQGLQGVGPVNAQLLEALISPMVDDGRIIAWRGVVQRTTGETDRNAQGAMVRQACRALTMVYEAFDEVRRRQRADHAAREDAARLRGDAA